MCLPRRDINEDWRKLRNEVVHSSCSDDHIKSDEMDGTCNTHGKDEKYVQNSKLVNHKERHLGVTDVDGRFPC
jgi:hypothetical protein